MGKRRLPIRIGSQTLGLSSGKIFPIWRTQFQKLCRRSWTREFLRYDDHQHRVKHISSPCKKRIYELMTQFALWYLSSLEAYFT
jgi:hypothetical protein